jgi:hypothetical protein
MPTGTRKQIATQDELNILAYWYSLKINAKGQDPQTGLYLSGRKTHTGLMCINGQNSTVASEKFQIELKGFPRELWKFAEAAPGSDVTPKAGSKKHKENVEFINANYLVRTGNGSDVFAPPKGIRFGGYRSATEAATVFKAWMDNPVLFIEAVMQGSGGKKYYQ